MSNMLILIEDTSYAHYAHMKKENEKVTERVQFLTTPTMVKEIEDYQFNNRLRTKGEAIRHLIETGLKKSGNK